MEYTFATPHELFQSPIILALSLQKKSALYFEFGISSSYDLYVLSSVGFFSLCGFDGNQITTEASNWWWKYPDTDVFTIILITFLLVLPPAKQPCHAH